LLPIWLVVPRQCGASANESARSSTSRMDRAGGPTRPRCARWLRVCLSSRARAGTLQPCPMRTFRHSWASCGAWRLP
jgi:hypothetical protein